MNVLCLSGKVIGSSLALELVETFLVSHFRGAPRHRRRLAKVRALENEKTQTRQGTRKCTM
jgi:ribose 5-phosphate isomerase B